MFPVEANEVFLTLGDSRQEAAACVPASSSTTGAAAKSGQARIVVSWDQPEDEVQKLRRALLDVLTD